MNGDDITQLQNKLCEYKFLKSSDVDGWFGPVSDKAAKKFEVMMGFDNIEYVSKEIWNALFSKNKENIDIYMLFTIINEINLKNCIKESESLMGYSTEGGERTKYLQNGKLLYEDIKFLGEMGQVNYSVYYLDNGLVIFEKEYSYPKQFDVKNAIVTNSTYYQFSGKDHVIKNGKINSYDIKKSTIYDFIKK
jgi:peptidoglycan hydrolase-like protein with peptidoglycan-binding domain